MIEEDDPRPNLPRDTIIELLSELKDGLKYEDTSEDAVFLMLGLESMMDRFPEYKEPYYSGQYINEFLDSQYFARGILEPLIKVCNGGRWIGSMESQLRAEAKKHNKEHLITKRLEEWLSFEFREYLSFKSGANLEIANNDPDKGYQELAEKTRLWLVEVYKEASEICKRAGSIRQVDEYRSMSERLLKDDFRETLPKAEKTKMDEELYWSILREAWDSSSIAAKRTQTLGEKLRLYNTTAIRKFASLYKRSIKKLNDYRAWDFVYIMEGGCGDDSFIDFKDTIVFLGRPELIDLILERPVEAAELLSTIPNVDLKEEYGLSSVIDFACLARSGRTIEWSGQGEPRGKMLEEKEIYAQYSELSQWVDKHGYLS